MVNEQAITLDFYKKPNNEHVFIGRRDIEGVCLEVALTDNGEIFNLPANSDVNMVIRFSNGYVHTIARHIATTTIRMAVFLSLAEIADEIAAGEAVAYFTYEPNDGSESKFSTSRFKITVLESAEV